MDRSSRARPRSSEATYAAKCAVGCKSKDICADKQSACEEECGVVTEGLSVECATCLSEHIYYAYRDCSGTSCTCCYSKGECGVCFDDPSGTGSECTGYDISKTTDSTCQAACGN